VFESIDLIEKLNKNYSDIILSDLIRPSESSGKQNSMLLDENSESSPPKAKFELENILQRCESLRVKRDFFTSSKVVKNLKKNQILFDEQPNAAVLKPLLKIQRPRENIFSVSPVQDGLGDMDVERALPTPGKGKKFLFKAVINGREINVIVDTGSSTSLVLKSLVSDLNLSFYTSRLPVNFLGMFGSKMIPDAKVASIALEIGDHKVAMPAYIMESLPKGSDLLIGTDQLGKSLGISIDLFNNFSISLFDSQNFIRTYRLGEERELMRQGNSCESNLDKTNEGAIFHLEDNSSTHFQGVSGDEVELTNERPIHVTFDTKCDSPSLLATKLEIENISSALNVLQKELNQLIALAEQSSNERSARSFLTTQEKIFLLRRSDLIAEFNIITDALSKELKFLKRKYKRKVRRLSIGNSRGKIRNKNKSITKNINFLDQGTKTPEDKKLNSSFKNPIDQHVSPIDIIEFIVDKGLYSNDSMNKDLVMSELFKKLELDETPIMSAHYRDEIVNLVSVASQKFDEIVPDVADWMNEVKRRDVFLLHHLLADEVARLNGVLSAYESSVLIGPHDPLVMGKATLKGEPISYHIELAPGGLEFLQKKKKKAYPNKRPMRDLLRSTANEMAKAGVGFLNQLDFSAHHASPVFFVKNKAKFRLVCDFKDLNSVTKDDIYPLPHLDHIFENLGNSNGDGAQSRYFSVLDLKSGYWQIPLEEAAQKLAAILLPFGIFRFICLPFGLKNAPAFFQRYMDKVLEEGLDNYVFVYIDDIVIFSKSFDDHIEHLNLVLRFLKESNLKANIEKCHFCLSQIKVLGKIVSGEGITTDPELISAMVEFPSPGNDIGNVAKKKLKRFLAMLSYYRTHVQDFGPNTDILSKLLKEDYLWDENSWTVEHEKSFRHLKELMLSAPIMAFPDFSKVFHLQSDASKVGAGAVLFQMNEKGHRFVVSYASWLFSDTERRYNTTERELLALILSVRKWKPFFYGTKFFAETDHEPLVGYLKLDDPYGKIARWSAELAQFSFQIKYIKGETNIPADTLSRTKEEVDIIESIFSCSVGEADVYLASHRPSRVLSKAFKVEDEDLFTCIESDIDENIFINSLCFATPTNQEWIDAQLADPELGPVVRWLKQGTLPADINEAKSMAKLIKHYALDSVGILVYSSVESVGPWRKCVPRNFRKFVLSECHDSLWSGGHLGRDKTKDKLRGKYYFSRMDQYTEIWCKTCPTCLSTKRKHPSKLQIPVGTITTSKTWELVSIDLWEAGVLSDRGHKYVLTVIDGFSKYAIAIPIMDKKASTIAQELYQQVFSRFGYPDKLHSDNGLEFCNAVLIELCKILRIEKTHTTAYHPQGNAFAERIHQFFRNALASFVGRDQRDWDLLIPALVNVYLESIHSSLGGFSPSQIMFGRQIGTPDAVLNSENGALPTTNVLSYAAKLKLALDRAQEVVQKIVKEKQFKNIKPSLGKLTLSYNVGDKVGFEVESLPAGVKSAKLFPRYSGPFTITKVAHGGKVLRLADVNGKERKVPNSIQHVKPWPDRQTLLEQFENFEIMRRQSKSKSINSSLKQTTISTPKKVVEVNVKARQTEIPEKSIPNKVIEMEVEEKQTEISKFNSTPSRYQELDIMGNPIFDDDDDEDINALRTRVEKKLELVSNSMFTIYSVECYYTRPLFRPTGMKPGDYLEQDLYFINSDNLKVNNICTNIII
jgi:hypothetical protein